VKLVGDRLSFSAQDGTFNGRVDGNMLESTWKDANGERNIKATRNGTNLPPLGGNATDGPDTEIL
jgi:hypothetical protein